MLMKLPLMMDFFSCLHVLSSAIEQTAFWDARNFLCTAPIHTPMHAHMSMINGRHTHTHTHMPHEAGTPTLLQCGQCCRAVLYVSERYGVC